MVETKSNRIIELEQKLKELQETNKILLNVIQAEIKDKQKNG